MSENAYLKWLSSTKSCFWNDSAVYSHLDDAIANGATGVTTNPFLIKMSLYKDTDFWRPYLEGMDKSLTGDDKAEEIIRRITVAIAKKFQHIFDATGGKQGYVCAQVNPLLQSDTEKMIEQAKRLNSWAKNIAVKLPGTAAGIDAIEECAALGITTVGTVSFTVPQAVEIAKRQDIGAKRAAKAGITGKNAFSVVMVGRQDDYLRDVAKDNRVSVSEEDIKQSGVAVIKRAYAIVKEAGYASQLMPAALRGTYHAFALSGADMSMSIATNIQDMLVDVAQPFDEGINKAVDAGTIDRLMQMDEFCRAYEPDAMAPHEFISYGICQRTLSQFIEGGWLPIVNFVL